MPNDDEGEEDGLQLALLLSAFDQLVIKYRNMLAQGASLGKELGQTTTTYHHDEVSFCVQPPKIRGVFGVS
jgi:hypothetical protein